MSNSHDYSLLFTDDRGLRKDTIAEAFRIIDRRGYSSSLDGPVGNLGDPNKKFSICVGLKGTEAILGTSAVLRALAAGGGVVDFWKERDHIALMCGPLKSGLFQGTHLSVNVTAVQFWENNPLRKRADFAEDVANIWMELCATLEPAFGYCIDEWRFEACLEAGKLPRFPIPEEVVRQAMPTVLCWLTYYPNAYFKTLGADAFESAPGELQDIGKGMVLRCCEYPWQTDSLPLFYP